MMKGLRDWPQGRVIISDNRPPHPPSPPASSKLLEWAQWPHVPRFPRILETERQVRKSQKGTLIDADNCPGSYSLSSCPSTVAFWRRDAQT